MNTNTVIAVVVALIVVIGGFVFFAGQSVPMAPQLAQNELKASMVPYANEDYNLSFQYPSNLYLYERSGAGAPERPQIALFLVENTQENRDLLEGKATEPREAPTGITVDVYQNPNQLSASDWVQNDTNWTVATSSAEPITIGDRTGVTYTWSGLYEGKTVVFTEGDKAYVFSVTSLTADDQILRDFEMVLNSFSI